ncbi:IS3 family transposase [Escherichia coli]
MPNHDRFECQTAIDSDAILQWSGITPEKFMQHVDAYIRWYNERRIKLSLGAVSPEMYR